MSRHRYRGGRDGVRLEATASGEAVVNQAGRDQHFHYGKGVRRTVGFLDGPDGGCPYPGLASFTADQAAWFFGRDRLTAELVSRLDACLTEGGPVMVVAASGAGKSSLLRAGLLTRIAFGALTPAGSRNWPRVVFTPGAHPMRAAAAALLTVAPAWSGAWVPSDPVAKNLDDLLDAAVAAAGPGARAVLVVDQFEELFRLCEHEGERGEFISWLWRVASGGGPGGPAVLAACAVRADSYPDCTRYSQIRQALQGRQVIVGAMSPGELREVITYPAEAAGLEIEPGLTEVLLADLRAGNQVATAGNRNLAVDDGAGRLPLLAHALRVTWQQRNGSTLTVDGYKAAGGIGHAIADSAERVFSGLDEAGRKEARGLFLRLVKIGVTSGEDARRPFPRQYLARESGSTAAVIDAYTAARLLTQSRDTVQITHEALLRAWPRLAGWLDDDRAGQLTRQQTEDDATGWDQASRDSSLLYRGARLETVAAWAGGHRTELTTNARHFITASRRLARRSRALKRGGVAALAVLLLVATVISVVAFKERSDAIKATDTALSGISGQFASESELTGDYDIFTSRLKAIAASTINPSSSSSSPSSEQARYAMLRAASSPEITTLSPGADSVTAVAFSPRGTTLVTGDNDGTVELWNVATGQQGSTATVGHIETLDTGRSEVDSLALSPDGRTLATGNFDGSIELWNVKTKQQIDPHLGTSFNPVAAVAFSPHGTTLVTGSFGAATVQLWDVATRRRIEDLGTGSTGVAAVAFSRDGQLAIGYGDGAVQLWDVATRRRIEDLKTGSTEVESVAFSPDGTTLAAGSIDGTTVWNATNGLLIGELAPGLAPGLGLVDSVAFAAQGGLLATGDGDGTVRLWDTTEGLTHSFSAGSAGNADVSAGMFSPDGTKLAVGYGNGQVELWNVPTGRQVGADLKTGFPAVASVVSSPDGAILVLGDSTGIFELWNMKTRKQIGESLNVGSGAVVSAAFSPDGMKLAVGYGNGQVELWNVATGLPGNKVTVRHTGELHTGSNDASLVNFGPGGTILAVGDGDGEVELWNVATGRIDASLNTGFQAVVSVAFSPDGTTLAITGSNDRMVDDTVEFWDVQNEQQISSLNTGAEGLDSVAFSQGGSTLATGYGLYPDDGGEGDVATWNTSYLVNALARLCLQVKGSPTPAEWARYVSLACLLRTRPTPDKRSDK